MKRIREILISGLSAAVLVLLTSSSPAWAQNVPWTSVGAAGTVDPASMLLVAYGNPLGTGDDTAAAYLRTPPGVLSLITQTATIRYNVVSVPGILVNTIPSSCQPVAGEPLPSCIASGPGITLGARYLAANANEQVVVRLWEYNFASGVMSNPLTINSNDFMPSASFQVQYSPSTTVGDECENAVKAYVLDFLHNAYFIEATLTTVVPVLVPPPGFGPGGGDPHSPPALGVVTLTDPANLNLTCSGIPIGGPPPPPGL